MEKRSQLNCVVRPLQRSQFSLALVKAISLAIWVVLIVGCDSDRGAASTDTQQSSLDGAASDSIMLLDELRRIADRSIFAEPVPVHVDQVKFATVASSVVPGLTYHWAMYYPPEVSHGYYSVVAAEREDRLEILRDPPDWGVVARGWSPAGEREATLACLELVNVLTDDKPRAAPERVGEDLLWIENNRPPWLAADTFRQIRQALRASPKAQNRSEFAMWDVRLWVAQSSHGAAVRRYRCELPATPNSGPGMVELSAIDSMGTSFIPLP